VKADYINMTVQPQSMRRVLPGARHVVQASERPTRTQTMFSVAPYGQWHSVTSLVDAGGAVESHSTQSFAGPIVMLRTAFTVAQISRLLLAALA
jgi:hypothetical protein